MMPGITNYFNNIGTEVSPTLFFILLVLSISLTFGFGMFTGFIINLRMKKSGVLKVKIATLQSKINTG